jgi:hypothetical protein
MARQNFRFERNWKEVPNIRKSDDIGQRNFLEQKEKLDAMMSKVKNLIGGVNKLMEDYNEINEVLKEQEDVILRQNKSDSSGDQATDGGVDS